jgi:hypothetical protein
MAARTAGFSGSASGLHGNGLQIIAVINHFEIQGGDDHIL